MAQPDSPIRIFISYSQLDEAMLRQLAKHLAVLEADLWHDRKLIAGDHWLEELDPRLDTAEIILLLVSHNFISSNFCMKIELPRAFQREQAGEAIIIPIIVSACDWQHAAFSQFQILPTTRRAIESWERPNEAFADVVGGIRQAMEKRAEKRFADQAKKSPTTGRTIPRRLLPYLCDRSKQELALGEALRRHQQREKNRPVLCLIHGDELECHTEFLQRLQHKSLPKYAKGLVPKLYEMPPPPRGLVSHNALQAGLGEALLGDAYALPDDVLRFIAGHAEPMIISLHLLTKDFAESGEALLQSFIEFCRQWPDLPPERLVVVCLCLKYQRFGKAGFFDFKTKKLQQLNGRLRAFIEQANFENDPLLDGVALPELRAVERGDVEYWSRVNAVAGLSEREIRALFDQQLGLCNEDGHIPMEVLAEKLKTFING